MSNEHILLTGISPASWEHPADQAALSLLRSVPGLGELVKTVGSLVTDKSLRLYFLGSGVRTSELQVPRLHRAVAEGCRILDLDQVPEVFVQNGTSMNALALGFQKPFLVFHSSLVKEFSDDELLNVVGHELAHIKAGHLVYKTLLWILTSLSFQITQADALVRLPVVLALRDWERKSELSCDRAGLLVCQNPRAAQETLMHLGAGTLFDQCELDEMVKQAEEYETQGDLLDSLYKFVNVMDHSHPMIVTRLRALKLWQESGAYASILGGNYWKNGEEPQVKDHIRQAYDHWKSDLSGSKDMGSQVLSRFVQEGEKAVQDLDKLVRKFFG